MERSILLIAILIIIGVGVSAGVGGLASGLLNQPQQMTYETIKGECQIRIYDDPLYAEHWAKNVNPYNCQSYKTQEEANNIKAQTQKVNVETGQMRLAGYSIFGFVGLGLLVLVVAIVKGGVA